MVRVKAIGDIAEKWAKETPARQPYYAAGIENPTKDWAESAAAAEPAYAAGVQEAIGRKAFSKGVREVGTEKWQRKAREVGVPRYGPGVTAAKGDYMTRFGPYRDELERVSLPTRGPRGDPRNLERVKAIADALHKRRISTGK